jgi:hypothetical protein
VSDPGWHELRELRERPEITVPLAGLLPIMVAILLVPLREDRVTTNLALILVVAVVGGAAIAGRAGGAFAAVTAALSFDFFLTRPYLSLHIESADDIETTLLLLIVGLLVGQLAVLSRQHQAEAEQGRSEIRRLRRLTDLVARGEGSADVLMAAQTELTGLFDLEGCRFEAGLPDGSRPVLERTGAVNGQREWRFARSELALPAAGVDLPVLGHGRPVGRFVLHPRAGVGSGSDERGRHRRTGHRSRHRRVPRGRAAVPGEAVMTTNDWILVLAVVVAIAVATPLLGSYMARVFGGGAAPGDRVFGPIERFVDRLCGIDREREQRWTAYALSLLAFSLVSVLFLFVLQRVQQWLPLNPTDMKSVPPALAFNTAVSFVTNTNWQNYSGETTMSHFTQMVGLATQNFVSAAVGMAAPASSSASGRCSSTSGAPSTGPRPLPAGPHGPHPAEARARPLAAPLLPHRAGHGLPVRARRRRPGRGMTCGAGCRAARMGVRCPAPPSS